MTSKFELALRGLILCTGICIWILHSHHLHTAQPITKNIKTYSSHTNSFIHSTKSEGLKSLNHNKDIYKKGVTSRETKTSFYESSLLTTRGEKTTKPNKFNAGKHNTGFLGKVEEMRTESQSKHVTAENIMTTPRIQTMARPLSCNKCFKRPYPFIFNSDSICHGLTNSSVSLFVFILTTHNQEERRDVLRNTWASLSRNNTSPFFRYVFLLGSSSKESGQKLQAENNIHHDMVQQNFTDSYRNLTLKTMMGFEWFTRFCNQASFVMKTDDDVFINVTNILRLAQQPEMQNKILGYCNKMEYPMRGNAKWAVTLREYPQKTYPGFCHGVGYLMLNKIAKGINFISEQVPFLHLEDVYVGLCAHRLRVPVQHVPGFRAFPLPIHETGCGEYRSQNLFAMHGLTPQNMMRVWRNCERFHKRI